MPHCSGRDGPLALDLARPRRASRVGHDLALALVRARVPPELPERGRGVVLGAWSDPRALPPALDPRRRLRSRLQDHPPRRDGLRGFGLRSLCIRRLAGGRAGPRGGAEHPLRAGDVRRSRGHARTIRFGPQRPLRPARGPVLARAVGACDRCVAHRPGRLRLRRAARPDPRRPRAGDRERVAPAGALRRLPGVYRRWDHPARAPRPRPSSSVQRARTR